MVTIMVTMVDGRNGRCGTVGHGTAKPALLGSGRPGFAFFLKHGVLPGQAGRFKMAHAGTGRFLNMGIPVGFLYHLLKFFHIM